MVCATGVSKGMSLHRPVPEYSLLYLPGASGHNSSPAKRSLMQLFKSISSSLETTMTLTNNDLM